MQMERAATERSEPLLFQLSRPNHVEAPADAQVTETMNSRSRPRPILMPPAPSAAKATRPRPRGLSGFRKLKCRALTFSEAAVSPFFCPHLSDKKYVRSHPPRPDLFGHKNEVTKTTGLRPKPAPFLRFRSFRVVRVFRGQFRSGSRQVRQVREDSGIPVIKRSALNVER